jgi:riboflavin synthase
MFTGIITDIGTISSAQQQGDLRLVIHCHYDMASVAEGASIACSGVCLTVVDKGRDANGEWFAVDASAETVERTARGMWEEGRRLNLERAMKLGDELGGHIVTGHVDGVGCIDSIVPEGGSHRVAVRVEPALSPFVAAKGSITVDGVSLTVNAIEDQTDGATLALLNIIPHTWDVTTLGGWSEGAQVNIEIDVLARYLARMRDRTAT